MAFTGMVRRNEMMENQEAGDLSERLFEGVKVGLPVRRDPGTIYIMHRTKCLHS